MQKIGIIAGGGQLPKLLANEAKAMGILPVICGFDGHTDLDIANYSSVCQVQNLGAYGRLLSFFKSNQVKDLCLVGAIKKPKIMDIKPDLRGAKLAFSLKAKGDNSLLSAILSDLEKEGFNIRSAGDILPSLRCPNGLLTKRALNIQEQEDLDLALPILKELGKMDIGQCLVVKNGVILAVECIEGTDATIKRAGSLGGTGALVVKIAKPKQDLRVDMPSIGLQTIENIIASGVSALAVEAGNTLFFDKDAAIKLANDSKIAIFAF